MVQLTEAVIKSKTRSANLNEVRHLNLWGQGLTGLSILAKTPNVEVLSLSVNSISSLRPFLPCSVLRELYLRKNEVADLSGLRFLMPLRHLRVLWLSDNPCATDASHYRSFVIAHLPQLEKLDNLEVTQEERDACLHLRCLAPAAPHELLHGDDDQQQQQQQQQGADEPDAARGRPDGRVLAAPGLAAHAAAASHRTDCHVQGARAAGQPSVQPHAGTTLLCSEAHTPSNLAVDDSAACHRQEQQQQLYDPLRYSSQAGAPPQPDDDLSPQPQQQQPEATVRPGWSAAAAGSQAVVPPLRSSKNVLYAVMALLSELDESALVIVQREVQQRLQQLPTL